MTRAVELLAIAEADMAEAKEWYRRCHPYLETNLILCVEETLGGLPVIRSPFPV